MAANYVFSVCCCEGCDCGFCFQIEISMDDETGHSGVLQITSSVPAWNSTGAYFVSGFWDNAFGSDPYLLDLCVSVIPFDDGVNPTWPATGTFQICISHQNCGQDTPLCDMIDCDGTRREMPNFTEYCCTFGPSEHCLELGAACPETMEFLSVQKSVDQRPITTKPEIVYQYPQTLLSVETQTIQIVEQKKPCPCRKKRKLN